MKETRQYLPDAELRVETLEGGETKIVGYAAKYNSSSLPIRDIYGSFIERIQPGAFDSANLKDVRFLYGHDTNQLIARTPNTLTVIPDGNGLRIEATIPNTTVGKDAVEQIKRGDMRGMSFGFTGNTLDVWAEQDGQDVRTITGFDEIFDVSLTAFPAYPETEVAIRSREEYKKNTARGQHNINAKAKLRLAEADG